MLCFEPCVSSTFQKVTFPKFKNQINQHSYGMLVYRWFNTSNSIQGYCLFCWQIAQAGNLIANLPLLQYATTQIAYRFKYWLRPKQLITLLRHGTECTTGTCFLFQQMDRSCFFMLLKLKFFLKLWDHLHICYNNKYNNIIINRVLVQAQFPSP